jgi:hypothetical protein
MFEYQSAKLAPKLLLDTTDEEVARLLNRETADALQRLKLVVESLSEIGGASAQLVPLLGHLALHCLEVAFLAGDEVELLVEKVRTFLDPAFLVPQFASSRFDLGLEVFAAAEDLLLGSDLGLPPDGIRLAMGIGHNLLDEPARGLMTPQPEDEVRGGKAAGRA